MTDTTTAPIASHLGWSLLERAPGPDSWRNYLLLAPEGVSPRRYHIGLNTAESRLSWNKDVRGLERRHPAIHYWILLLELAEPQQHETTTSGDAA
jgi:hypothetical protein